MTRFLLLVVAAALVGCAAPDPETSPLVDGSPAIIAGPEGAALAHPEHPLDIVLLQPGTRVTVGYDPGAHRANGDGGSTARDVKIVVESGEHRGRAGSITRRLLRPSR